jgi:molecular chaperone Hsp33
MTAALGRLLTAGSMMGNMLKGENHTITLRITGEGPAKAVVVAADSKGDVRGYTTDPVVEIPLKENGKLDVSGAIGKNGTLTVIKDIGMKEPYNGFLPLVSGEIAEDITSYFATSEQLPSVCALGVLVNPDISVACAGGFIIQLLPAADEETISKVEKCLEGLKPVTTMLAAGMKPEDICVNVLNQFEMEILDEFDIDFKCDCSRNKVEKALISAGVKELCIKLTKA